MRTISSEDLRPTDVPADEAPLSALMDFAHTFDGYKECGSFERCAEIANAKDHTTLDNLRTCLFFEARRWRHFGEDPDEESEAYWRQVVALIRSRVDVRT